MEFLASFPVTNGENYEKEAERKFENLSDPNIIKRQRIGIYYYNVYRISLSLSIYRRTHSSSKAFLTLSR